MNGTDAATGHNDTVGQQSIGYDDTARRARRIAVAHHQPAHNGVGVSNLKATQRAAAIGYSRRWIVYPRHGHSTTDHQSLA